MLRCVARENSPIVSNAATASILDPPVAGGSTSSTVASATESPSAGRRRGHAVGLEAADEQVETELEAFVIGAGEHRVGQANDVGEPVGRQAGEVLADDMGLWT